MYPHSPEPHQSSPITITDSQVTSLLEHLVTLNMKKGFVLAGPTHPRNLHCTLFLHLSNRLHDDQYRAFLHLSFGKVSRELAGLDHVMTARTEGHFLGHHHFHHHLPCIEPPFREGTTYNFSCFFIKFIRGGSFPFIKIYVVNFVYSGGLWQHEIGIEKVF